MKDGINQCGGSGIESVDHFDGVGIVRIRPVVNKVEIKRAKRLIVARIQFVSATLVFGLAAFDCSLAISSSHTSLGVL